MTGTKLCLRPVTNFLTWMREQQEETRWRTFWPLGERFSCLAAILKDVPHVVVGEQTRVGETVVDKRRW